MARHKLFRSSKRTVEVEGHGVGYNPNYPIVNERGEIISKGGSRIGQAQFYDRTAGGRYEKRRRFKLPGEYKGDEDSGDRFKWTFDRDIRILLCIGIIIAVFIIMFVVMTMVFDAVGGIFTTTGLDATQFNSFRTQASLCLGVVVALIVGAGSAMFLFDEEEVNDAIFQT